MTITVRGQPPGRAGVTWLLRRRQVAERGSDLLERKLRILLAEEQDYALRVGRTRQRWEQACADLELWLLRSAIVSGERGLRLATDGAPATIEIEWRLTMGVRYPAQAVGGMSATGGFAPDNSALHYATSAAQDALDAGIEHAAASAALAAITAEIAATRRQLRALQRMWLPRLETALAHVSVQLYDIEHDEHVRLRWAADATRGRRLR